MIGEDDSPKPPTPSDPRPGLGDESSLPQHADATIDSGSAGAPAAGQPLPTPTVIGNYHLVKLIGEGGMGQVWLAEQTAPVKRRVALKLIKGGLFDSTLIQRFKAERQSLAIMDHPAIAKVFDAGTTPEGRPYFVMEYVDGLPITWFCDQKKLKIHERLSLFIQVCEGVQHAHQKAIIHRDLKPSNILVVEVDGKPAPRIIDFGLAKAAAADESKDDQTMFTQQGAMLGTLGYMSPEQADPSVLDVDTRTDVYSLGVVLYELLTGVLPFDFRELRKRLFQDVLRQLREEDPPSPSRRLPRESDTWTKTAELRGVEPAQFKSLLQGDLDWITLTALDKDRNRRFGTPSELAADIHRYLQNEPVVARPSSKSYRIKKYVQRHRVGVAAAAVLVLLLVGFGVTQFLQVKRITRERDRADRVTRFVTGMFKLSNPSEARGNKITVREVLDKASKDVNAGLSQDPEVQAGMMDAMGEVYQNLGLYSQAQPLLEQAVSIRSRVLGPQNRQTLYSAAALATNLDDAGHLAEAEKSFEQILEAQRRTLGPENPDTLESLNSLAVILDEQSRYQEAEKLYRQLLEIQRRKLGPEHRGTLRTMSNLAVLLTTLGRYAEAEKLDREALQTMTRTLGSDHPQTLRTMANLAELLQISGPQSPEAEQLLRQAVDGERRVLGPEHAETLISQVTLADVLGREGKREEQLSLLNDTLEIQRRVLGPEHPATIQSMEHLFVALTQAGRLSEAETLGRETVEVRRRVLGPEHMATLQAMTNLAAVLSNERKFPEAEKSVRENIDLQRRVLGADSNITLTSQYNLALILAFQGKLAESEKWLRETRDVQARALGPERFETTRSTYFLAGVVLHLGRRDESLALLQDALDHKLSLSIASSIENDPTFKPLRGDPRFAAIVAQVRQKASAPQNAK